MSPPTLCSSQLQKHHYALNFSRKFNNRELWILDSKATLKPSLPRITKKIQINFSNGKMLPNFNSTREAHHQYTVSITNQIWFIQLNSQPPLTDGSTIKWKTKRNKIVLLILIEFSLYVKSIIISNFD